LQPMNVEHAAYSQYVAHKSIGELENLEPTGYGRSLRCPRDHVWTE